VLRNYEASSNERVGRQVLASEANGHPLVGRDRRIRRDQQESCRSASESFTPQISNLMTRSVVLDLGFELPNVEAINWRSVDRRTI
jgi:hypothetical protein